MQYKYSRQPENLVSFVLNTIYSLRENRQNLTKLATPRIVYYGEPHMKYPEYYAESKLPMSFTTGSHHSLRGVNHENLKDSPGL